MRKTNNLLPILSVSIGSIFYASCNPQSRNENRTQSVAFPETEVKSQGQIGFCWSYTTIAMLESLYKTKTGKTFDLSEEALGYWRIRYSLMRLGEKYKTNQVTRADLDKIKFSENYEGANVSFAMDLIDNYGVVPESAWSEKFESRPKAISMWQAVHTKFNELIDSGKPIDEAAIDQVLTSPGAFHSKPPTTFTFEGSEITATDFARNVLKFQSSDYSMLKSGTESETSTLIGAIKRSLIRGISVPLGFYVQHDLITNDEFQAPLGYIFPTEESPDSGYHAVLITDFVNVGSHEGKISADELGVEAAKGLNDLDYLKIKNSWGTRSTDSASPSDGYYKIMRDYLIAASEKNITIVVPYDIAINPLGQEPIRPEIVDNTLKWEETTINLKSLKAGDNLDTITLTASDSHATYTYHHLADSCSWIKLSTVHDSVKLSGQAPVDGPFTVVGRNLTSGTNTCYVMVDAVRGTDTISKTIAIQITK